jgi:sulfur-oxidizing protein SoxX
MGRRWTIPKAANALAVIATFAFVSILNVAANATDTADNLKKGRAIAMERGKGNCLACHIIEDGELPGTIGPPLVAMAARFPDKQRLRDQVWDATRNNPDSRMPPFGRHRLLTEEEIDLVTDYIYSL